MEHKPGRLVEGKLLRPLEWIESTGAAPGEEIWLDLPEMHCSGWASVLAIDPCPPIEPGTDPMITGTFRHVTDKLIELRFEGQDEPITCTPEHPFWSKTRADFLPANDLSVGEQILSVGEEAVALTSITPRDGPATVYGLEVYGEHVYHVGNLGFLVHNASARDYVSNFGTAADPQGLIRGKSFEEFAISDFRNSSAISGEGKIVYILTDSNTGEILKAGFGNRHVKGTHLGAEKGPT